MRIGLLSDTHGFLDRQIFSYFDKCDELWHAGDFGPVEILDQLKSFKPVRGVYGNIDGAKIRKELGSSLNWLCDEVRVYMTHIGGYPGHYEAGVKRTLAEVQPALFIAGHSHILKVMRDPALALIHMNPGACGHTGWHKVRTLLRFQIEGSRIFAVEAVELGPRGRQPTC